MFKMLVKVHKNPEGRIVLAICDNELIRKKFVEGDLQLDLTGDFYRGEEKSEDEIKAMIKEANVINAVGEESIKFLKKIKLVDEDKIITVAGVPHAEVVIVREE